MIDLLKFYNPDGYYVEVERNTKYLGIIHKSILEDYHILESSLLIGFRVNKILKYKNIFLKQFLLKNKQNDTIYYEK